MLTNLRSIQRRHEWLLRENRRMFDSELGDQVGGVHDHVRDQATFTHRTRKAQRGARAKIIRLKSGVRMRLTNVAKHARWLEFGTPAHTIRARKKKALSFIAGGRRITRRSVRHPGTRAYRFMWAAAKHAHQSLNPALRQAMRGIAKRF